MSHYCLCLYVFNDYKQIRLVFGDENLWNILRFTWFSALFYALRKGRGEGIHNTHSRKEKKKRKKKQTSRLKSKAIPAFLAREIIVDLFVLG